MTFTSGHTTFALSNGQSKTAENLPAGVTYTVSEIADDDFTTEIVGEVEADITKDATAEVTFTNTRETGGLTLSKELISDAAADKDQVFTFTVTLSDNNISGTYGDMRFIDGVATVTLKGGEDAKAEGLPTGIAYTITEAEATGFELTGITVGEDDQTEAGEATGAISKTASTVEFENTRETGELDVTKIVKSSTASDKQKDFSFRVTLTGLDATADGYTYGGVTFEKNADGAYVGTFTLKDGEKKSFDELPVGIRYEVEEETEEGWTTTKTGETGSVSATKATAVFTNSKVEGGLVVSKSVESPLPADKDKKFDFTVTLSDTAIEGTYGDMTFEAGVAEFQLADGESASAEGLPEGIGFKVEEAAADDFTTETSGTIEGNITKDATPAAEFKNTRETGDLTLSKELISDAAADKDQVFTFTVTLSDETISGTYGDMVFENGVATVTLKGGEGAKAEGLPTEITYTITEAEATGFELTGITVGADDQTEAGEATGAISKTASTVEFENTRETGDLDVTKTVVSDDDNDKTKKFSFKVTLSDTTIEGTYGDMTFEAGAAEFQLADGESAKAEGLPTCITYKVEEETEKGFITTKTGETGSISTELATAAFTNSKADKHEFEKKVKDTNDSTGETSDWQDSADYDIGDDVPFRLTATLANDVTSYRKYHITFNDKMEHGLTFKEITGVTVNGQATTDYELTPADNGFELTLRWAGADDQTIADETLNEAEVEVLFTATLNEDAVIGSTGNINAAKLAYSNNPSSADDSDEDSTEWDNVIVYTYKVDVSKFYVDEQGERVPLKGAEFKLEKLLADGTYKELASDVAGSGDDANVFSFEGLDDGTYRLTETTAPKGFKPAQVTFDVEAGHVTALDSWSETGEPFNVDARNDQLTSLTGDTESGELTFDGSDLPTGTVSGTLVDDELEKPSFEKKIADFNDSVEVVPDIKADGIVWKDSADYDLGDDVYFRLEAKLPQDIHAYKHYELTFEDKMEDTLFYNSDAEVVIEADGYTSQVTDVTDHSFKATVTFGSTEEGAEYLPEELAGKSVYVYFTAKLGKGDVEPVYGANGNMNAARLTYTNSATSGGEGDKTETTKWDNVIAFTYKVDFTKTDQTGQTAVSGAIFSLYKVMPDGTEKLVKENNVGSGNVFSFKGLDDGKYVLKETTVPDGYRKAEDITFTVSADHTLDLNSDGWSKSESANIVSDPARNEVLTSLTGNRTESGELDPNDINKSITFTPDGSKSTLAATVMNDENAKATIEATKKFENWDLFPEGTQFEFKLTAGDAKTVDDEPIGEDGKSPMPAGDGATAYATKDKTTAEFAEIAYEVPGIYTYTINEVDGGLPGVTYDTDDHEVTVKVNRPAENNNTLKATVAYDGSKEALEVENTFTALKEHFEVTKQLNGRKWTDEDSFTFELAAMAPTDAPMPTGDGATAYATKANGKVAKFGDIEFVKPGKYEYTITEVKPEGAEKINDTHYLLDGVTYETSSHHVIIEVAKSDDSNALVVKSVKYDGEKSLTVTNEYAANGEVNLTATKEVTGDDWPEGAEFTFTLTDVTDPEKPVDLGTATATKGAPTAAFDAIKYENITKDSTHEYTYEVAEVVPDNATNEDGITYAEATDEQKAAGGFMLDGVTYAHKPMTVKVKLTDNGDGTLSYAVTSQVEGESTVVINPTEGDPVTYMVGTFENDAYAREATVEFTKAFYGAENGKITFRMTPYIDGAKADGTTAADTAKSPLVYSAAQHIEWTALVKAKSHTVVTSPAITFYKAGTYQYLIEEVTDKAGADEATILATIVVDEDQEPTVTYQVSPYKDAEFMDIDEATFYNNELVTLNFRSAGMRKFNANKMITVFQPEIRKVLENGILAGGEFKFELRDEAGNLVSEATNDENGRVEFAAIRYEEAGEHTYTITEVAGTDSTINYSTETIELKVTVVENKTDGVLTATGTYSQDGKAVEVPTITNKYKTVGIHAVKYSREDLEKGIKTPLAGAHYGLWMVNPDGADIYLGVQESDAGGNLYYDIPTLEGVVYYFKEEEPPPAGHLVDPYPTDYFTLLIEGGQFSLKYFASYEEAVDYIKNNG